MQRWGFLRGAAAGGLVATGVTGTDRISPGGRRPGANITGLRSVIINLSLILAVFVTSTSQPIWRITPVDVRSPWLNARRSGDVTST